MRGLRVSFKNRFDNADGLLRPLLPKKAHRDPKVQLFVVGIELNGEKIALKSPFVLTMILVNQATGVTRQHFRENLVVPAEFPQRNLFF